MKYIIILICNDLIFTGCSSSEWQCDDGDCIPGSWVCDDWNDCGTNEDEAGCYSKYDLWKYIISLCRLNLKSSCEMPHSCTAI